jgi:hypothetical protein
LRKARKEQPTIPPNPKVPPCRVTIATKMQFPVMLLSLVVTFGFQDSFWFAISKWEVLEFFLSILFSHLLLQMMLVLDNPD